MPDEDLDAIRRHYLPAWLAWASGRAPVPDWITHESPEGQIITMLAAALEDSDV